MVQNMLRSDPRITGNPMAAQALDELANNPALAAQLAQMSADPRMQQLMQNPEQMQQMMQMAQAMPGLGGGAAGLPPLQWGGAPPAQARPDPGPSNADSNASNGNRGGGSDDAEQTEEEMIAEAIRRSLEDSQGH
jgi:hypothetical protein